MLSSAVVAAFLWSWYAAWIEGIDRSSLTVAGAPPLRGPLFMIATVGAIVWTSVGWFEMSIP